ncbi:leucine-rich repeat protein [Segatella copri]
MTSITIPSSVTYVGSDCFIGCDNIETVYFNRSIPITPYYI